MYRETATRGAGEKPKIFIIEVLCRKLTEGMIIYEMIGRV